MESFESGYEHLDNGSEVRVLIKSAIECGRILFFQIDQRSLDLSAHAEVSWGMGVEVPKVGLSAPEFLRRLGLLVFLLAQKVPRTEFAPSRHGTVQCRD